MKFNFYAQRRDDELKIEVTGDVLIVNGEEFDFSYIGEGETLPHSAIASDTFLDDVTRTNGELTFGIIIPHKTKPHQKIAFPESVEISNGVLIDTANSIYPWSLE